MKRLTILFAFLLISVQYSCTTKATSAERVSSEVQEITVARNINAADFNKFLKEKQSAILLDVRTSGEVAQGYIDGAVNIDINSQQFRAEVAKLDKTKPIMVYCRSGRRSASAMRYMRDNGFVEVYNLNGGIISWNQEGLPIAK